MHKVLPFHFAHLLAVAHPTSFIIQVHIHASKPAHPTVVGFVTSVLSLPHWFLHSASPAQINVILPLLNNHLWLLVHSLTLCTTNKVNHPHQGLIADTAQLVLKQLCRSNLTWHTNQSDPLGFTLSVFYNIHGIKMLIKVMKTQRNKKSVKAFGWIQLFLHKYNHIVHAN